MNNHDFLSNFSKENYPKMLDDEQQNIDQSISQEVPQARLNDARAIGASNARIEPSSENLGARKARERQPQHTEEFEVDKHYQKKQRRKKMLYVLLGLLACLLAAFSYYKINYIKVPNLVNQTLSEARTWAAENKITLDIKQSYDMKHDANEVMEQAMAADKKIKKGQHLKLVVSMGADPDQVIGLPNFTRKTEAEVNDWIKENKANNVTILKEYSDKIQKGKFIKQEITDKDISSNQYRRKDRANIYFSKGIEKLEKNIAVPDFTKKTKAEVETWAKSNEIDVTYEEVDSDTIEEGMVVSQSIGKNQKVAKKSAMTVKVSLGKGITVPNFADLNAEQASTTTEGLAVVVKQTFSANVPYGKMISQSEPAGKKLTNKDAKTVTVVYSAGRPYLRDYRGKLEGDLPQAFFEDYQSKGANVKYNIMWVNSDETKGTVVEQSAYNQYIGMEYVVNIGISNGKG